MPHIDWENNCSPAPPMDITHTFLETLNDRFLTQHVSQPTRYRAGETPHILYLILTNEEGMVRNLHHESGPGRSDNVIIQFDLTCFTYPQEFAVHLNYFKGRLDKLIRLVQEIDWESSNTVGVDDKYRFMAGCLNRIACECFPKKSKKKEAERTYTSMAKLSDLRKK